MQEYKSNAAGRVFEKTVCRSGDGVGSRAPVLASRSGAALFSWDLARWDRGNGRGSSRRALPIPRGSLAAWTVLVDVSQKIACMFPKGRSWGSRV